MATKDWKHTTLGKEWEQWKSDEYIVNVRASWEKGKPLWATESIIRSGNRERMRRWFKTKSQALKFAKSYMRKH